MKNKIKSILVALVYASALASLSVWWLHDFMTLSVVALNPDGECEWVRVAPDYEMRKCPVELPKRFDVEHVGFQK